MQRTARCHETRLFARFDFHPQETDVDPAGGHDLCVACRVDLFAMRRPIAYGIIHAVFVGTGVGLFEEFYVQSLRGRWLRNMHPLLSIAIYTTVVVLLFVVALHLSHLATWRLEDLPIAYWRLPLFLPLVIAFSVIGIVVMRTVHFIGIENLFHLMIGTYHRPVIEEKVLLFLDINDSTGLAERLGAIQIKSLVGKFLFDVSKPITDYGGEIYLYKGDGLIALWNWNEAIRGNRILRAIDAVFASVRREEAVYQRQFGVVPRFRIGVHGGEVVVSEQGDTKRAIGVYGSTINIAARMEEAAKAHHVACAISGDVVQALSDGEPQLLPIGDEQVKGMSVEIPIFEYRVNDETGTDTPDLGGEPARECHYRREASRALAGGEPREAADIGEVVKVGNHLAELARSRRAEHRCDQGIEFGSQALPLP